MDLSSLRIHLASFQQSNEIFFTLCFQKVDIFSQCLLDGFKHDSITTYDISMPCLDVSPGITRPSPLLSQHWITPRSSTTTNFCYTLTSIMPFPLLDPKTLGNKCSQFTSPSLLSHLPPMYRGF